MKTIQKREGRTKTIQKRGNLNSIQRVGEGGPGGAHHEYVIYCPSPNGMVDASTTIKFQKGPRSEISSVTGPLDSDLLEIVRDRLSDFQRGPYATRENELALVHVETALLWMNKRVEDRIEREVLGTTKI